MLSAEAGCASTLSSDTRAAAVYWRIIIPESTPDAALRAQSLTRTDR
jgi:hypothetical protein